MKSITITSPEEIFQKTVDSLCYLGGYVDIQEDNDNLKLNFAKEQLIKLLGDKIREYIKMQIRQIAQIQVEQTIQQANQQIADTYSTISIEII